MVEIHERSSAVVTDPPRRAVGRNAPHDFGPRQISGRSIVIRRRINGRIKRRKTHLPTCRGRVDPRGALLLGDDVICIVNNNTRARARFLLLQRQNDWVYLPEYGALVFYLFFRLFIIVISETPPPYPSSSACFYLPRRNARSGIIIIIIKNNLPHCKNFLDKQICLALFTHNR